jgi:hypothetical protein
MDLLKKFGGIMAALCVASLLLAGCFREQAAATGPAVEQPAAPAASEREWVEYLTDRYQGWLKDRDAVIYVDSVTGDSSVIFGARIKAGEEVRGIRPTAVAFRKAVVERMMAKRDSSAPANLRKGSQTRWNAGDFDVKALTEVHQIKVYFVTSGPNEVTPNWLAAAREAVVRWNNVRGTHISFTEVGSSTDADIIVKGAINFYGWGLTTWLTPDPWVEKDAVEIYYNRGYESVIPQNQKIAYAMMGFGNILNITFTGTEGETWETGTFVNIPGTPTNDPLSVFQNSIGPDAYTQFSVNDIRAIQQMYPVWGSLAKNSNNDLISAGWEAPMTIANNVASFLTQGDTLYFLKNDGSLWRRLSTTASNVQLWNAASYGALSSFTVSGGWVAAQKGNVIYTRKVTHTTWFTHNTPPGASGTPKYRLAGDRLSVWYPSTQDIHSRFCNTSNNSTPWVYDWNGHNVTDFQTVGNRLVVIDNGDVYGKDGTDPNTPWEYLWAAQNGTPLRVYLSNELTLMSVDQGSWYHYTYFSNALSANWALFANPTDLDAVDVCGDKAAAINYNGTFYIWDVPNWIGYSHSPISDDWGSSRVRISGPMCDHVTRIGQYGDLWAKYSVSTSTGYLHYGSGFSMLQQRP